MFYNDCINSVSILKEALTDDNLLVVYSLVKKHLNMSSGKIGSQCGHAVHYLLKEYYEKLNCNEFNQRMTLWIESKEHTKITLSTSDKEWEILKKEYNFIYVTDAGKTEISTGTETVAILYPMLKSERSKVLKRCQALK